MRAEGLDVTAAEDAPAALRALADGFRPCVIVLDLRLPGMSGLDLAARLAADPHRAAIPVVVASGDGVGMESRARQVGACAFLLKPIDPGDLLAAIRANCVRAH
jgi:CheY-like chemotaxis protein